MFETVNWTLVFTALTAIFSFIAAITEIYYRVYIPRSKDKDKKREDVYKPLLNDVDVLIASVKKREKFSEVFNWKTVKEKVSPKFFEKLKELFEVKAHLWYKLLEHNRDFLRYQCYFYVNTNLENLQKEFGSLGSGNLGNVMFEVTDKPLIESEKISLRWLEDNQPELFELLKKCASYKSLKSLFDWINVESPCLVYYKNAEQDLMQSAQKMRNELKSF